MSDRQRLLLDTHVWLWYVEGEERRLAPRIQLLVEAALEQAAVIISTISVWEIAMLEAGRRIELSYDLREWVARAGRFPGVRLKGLSAAIAIESTRLPGELHRDPADRILVATARQFGASLVTCDERLIAYGQRGHLRVTDARPGT